MPCVPTISCKQAPLTVVVAMLREQPPTTSRF